MMGALDVLFLLGADEYRHERDRGRHLDRLYRQPRGMRAPTAPTSSCRVATFAEKSGTYVNTEGRVQMTNRARLPRRAMRARTWAISFARCRMRSATSCPSIRCASCGQISTNSIRIWRASTRSSPVILADIGAFGQEWRARVDKGAFASPVKDFYLTNPIARASAVMAEMLGPRQRRVQAGSGIGTGTKRWIPSSPYMSWPGLVILFQSVLLLVVLLVLIAYLLYADRKIWAAVQLRRGPNVGGPLGTSSSPLPICSNSSSRSR